MAKTHEHRDKLNNPLAVGDFVAYPQRNSLDFGRVIKLNAKMVKVEEVVGGGCRWKPGSYNKYPQDLVRVEASAMTFYILKNSNS